MKRLNGRITGNDKIRVVTEPLQAAVPDISVDIIIGARGQPKKLDVPHSSQDEPGDDDAPLKSRCCEELADREQVRGPRKRKRRIEVRSTPIAEAA
jgi:hypothetical protein